MEHDATNSPQPNYGFVKMMRSPEISELIEVSPLAFTLAAVIALRARFRSGVSLKGLQPGEAFLGDFRKCGLSERQYRTAKEQLSKWRFATFRATNKGTIAKLTDTRLFDVLSLAGDEQRDSQPTNVATDKATPQRRLTKNGKNDKTEKNAKEGGSNPPRWQLLRDEKTICERIRLENQKRNPDKGIIDNLEKQLVETRQQMGAKHPDAKLIDFDAEPDDDNQNGVPF